MASKTLSTALRDKATTYNRLRKAKRDPLNRPGPIIAGFLGMHLASAPLSFDGSHLTESQGVLLYLTAYTAVSQCCTSKYENFTIVSPSRTEGHTITQY